MPEPWIDMITGFMIAENKANELKQKRQNREK